MHDGYLPGELVAQLKCCVLPAINFLLAHGAYTALYRAHEIAVAEQMASEATMRNTNEHTDDPERLRITSRCSDAAC